MTGKNRVRPGVRPRGAIAAAGAASILGALLVGPGMASAEPPTAGCTQPDRAGVVRCIYTTAGTHTLTVPLNVGSVQVSAVGGRGGSHQGTFAHSSGGQGAVVTGTVSMPTGTRTLYAVVGGNGGDTVEGPDDTPGAAGANGGGNGGRPYWPGREDQAPGAGGGGASDVRTDATDLTSRVLVAAGGGGATYFLDGNDADTPSTQVEAGQAATATAGGAGGQSRFSSVGFGKPGRLGVGGDGGSVIAGQGVSTIIGGGGGGGGLYGGGGGSVDALGSGGGGSSASRRRRDCAERRSPLNHHHLPATQAPLHRVDLHHPRKSRQQLTQTGHTSRPRKPLALTP